LGRTGKNPVCEVSMIWDKMLKKQKKRDTREGL
jgi:hypothetical protein